MSSADQPAVRPVRKSEIFAWTLYDWANSSFSTLLITVVVVYVSTVVMPINGSLFYSYGIGGTMFVAALLCPILGAIADTRANKSTWFRWTSLPGSLAAGALGLVSPDSPWLFAAFFLIANVGYELSWNFYNAFLPEIADQNSMNRVSSYGFALGYIGGGLALLLAIFVLTAGDKLGLPTAGPLERDYVSAEQIDFAVELPAGEYEATVTLGDLVRPHERMAISLQGAEVDVVNTAKGEFVSRTYPFVVGAEKSKLPVPSLLAQVASQDPTGAPAVLNGLTIKGAPLKSPLVFDFGTASSEAADGSYWLTHEAESRWGEKDAAWLKKHAKPAENSSLSNSVHLGLDPFKTAESPGALGSRDGVIIPRLQICLVIMGAWWALFSLPALILLRDRTLPSAEKKSIAVTTRDAFAQVKQTLSSVRNYKMLFLFLVAFLIYNDGVQTIITQASVFAQEVLHIGAGDLVMVVLMIQFVSMPGALLMGWLANKWGEKPTLMLCIGIYIAWLLAAFFITTLAQFWVMGAVLALVMGGIQSVSRGIMGQMTPASRSGEFFGFFSLSGKATSFAGPIVFGSILHWSGKPHWAILSLLIFFVVGGALASQINVAEGRRRVQQED